jgi:hypothetical protein
MVDNPAGRIEADKVAMLLRQVYDKALVNMMMHELCDCLRMMFEKACCVHG